MQTELGPTDLENIKTQLEKLNVAEKAIARAKLAGIDMAPQEQQLRESRAQLNRLKSVYFPGQ